MQVTIIITNQSTNLKSDLFFHLACWIPAQQLPKIRPFTVIIPLTVNLPGNSQAMIVSCGYNNVINHPLVITSLIVGMSTISNHGWLMTFYDLIIPILIVCLSKNIPLHIIFTIYICNSVYLEYSLLLHPQSTSLIVGMFTIPKWVVNDVVIPTFHALGPWPPTRSHP